MNVQILEKNGHPEWAIIPFSEYQNLVEQAELLDDIKALNEVLAKLARGEEEFIPEYIAEALWDGQNPLKVWREYRGVSQNELAEQIGISAGYLSQLETGKRTGTADVLARIARALSVDIEDLLTYDEE